MPTKLNPRIALLRLAQNQGNIRLTARQLGISHTTLRGYRDADKGSGQPTDSTALQVSMPALNFPLDTDTAQTQQPLIASQDVEYPLKAGKIALWGKLQDLSLLELVDRLEDEKKREALSFQQLAVVAGIAADKTEVLVYGRHKQSAQVVEQHLHTGPEYHRAAAANAAKHPKHRRKQS